MSQSATSHPAPVRFGPFVFEPATGELFRGGQRVPLRPKASEILGALIEARGRLVSRERLIERAWPGTILEAETALHTAVRQIRRALGDSAAQPVYIETIHRRGYRFAGRLTSRTRWWRPRPTGWAVAGVALLLLLGAGWRALSPPVPEADPQVIRAAYLLSRGGPGDVHRAQEMVEPLVSERPRSPRAWSTLASVYSRLQRYPDAEETARRALQLDARSAEAHRVLGESAMLGRGDWVSAEHWFLRALDLDPNDAGAHSGYAFWLVLSGAPEEATAEMRRALALEPLSTLINGDAAYIWLWAGQYEEAAKQARRTLEIEPGYLPALECLRLSQMALGALEEARATAIQMLGRVEEGRTLIATVAAGHPAVGMTAYGEWVAERTGARRMVSKPNSWVWHGLALAEIGRDDAARAAFSRARELGATMLGLARLDPRARDLRM